MPLFTYVCESCGAQAELLRTTSEGGVVTCDQCGAGMRPQLGRFACGAASETGASDGSCPTGACPFAS